VLLDRQRTKFWQRIVFSLMAILMVAWLVGLGVSQLVCNRSTTSANGLDDRVTVAVAAVQASPADPQVILAAATAFQDRALAQQDGSTGKTSDFTQALTYFTQYVALKDKALGPDARQRRIDAYMAMARIHAGLGDAKGAASDYTALTGLEPKNADNFLQLGRLAGQAGDNRMAYLAYARYLEMEPSSDLAPLVKKELKRIETLLASESKVSPTPAPSGGN